MPTRKTALAAGLWMPSRWRRRAAERSAHAMTCKVDGPEVLTRAEVARVLGIHPSTVARWAASGRLPCLRTPSGERRYRRSDVEDMLNRIRTGWHTPARQRANGSATAG